MFYFTKTQFFRATLIAVSVLSCYQPELSNAQNHTAKVKHIKHVHKITHVAHARSHSHLASAHVATMHATKKHWHVKKVAPPATAENIQFTIGPNNTIVANNVVIQPAPMPAAEETGIEILSEIPNDTPTVAEAKPVQEIPPAVEAIPPQIISAPQPVAQPVAVSQQVQAAMQSATQDLAPEPAPVVRPTAQPVATITEAPRSFFQFHRDEQPAAPVKPQPQTTIVAAPQVTKTSEPARGFFHFLKREKTAAQTAAPIAQPVSTNAEPPHGFFQQIPQSTPAQSVTVVQQAPIVTQPVAPIVITHPTITQQQANAGSAPARIFAALFHKPPAATSHPVALVTTTPPTAATAPAPQTPVVATAAQPGDPMQQQLSPAPQHRFFQFHRDAAEPATVSVTVTAPLSAQTTSHGFGNIAASMQKHIVDFVKSTVSTLRYSDYKLGGSKFDTSRGIYIVDCSSFVDHILKKVSPHAYTSLVNATGAPTPATQHYYEFFKELTNNSDDYWNKVNNVEQLRAGDILVFRTKQHGRHGSAAGHVMVVMEKPIKELDVYFVRVADSAPARHSEDTRQHNEGGIGIGTLLLKAAKSGRPFAYAWSVGGYWNKNVNFAMARPTEWN